MSYDNVSYVPHCPSTGEEREANTEREAEPRAEERKEDNTMLLDPTVLELRTNLGQEPKLYPFILLKLC